jgi:hypothetical protein
MSSTLVRAKINMTEDCTDGAWLDQPASDRMSMLVNETR